MRKIRQWLAARGYRLRRGTEFAVDVTHREVTYPRCSYHLRVIGLLHECGHVLCGEKYDYFRDPSECLHEELEAWYRGWRLAQRLGVRVSRRAYVRERNARVAAYARALTGR